MSPRFPALAMMAIVSASATAAAPTEPALTIYRSNGDMLFEAGSAPVSDGYAVVHEQRDVQLSGGRQTLVVDGLPAMLDTEAVAVDFGGSARTLAQRVVSAGDAGLLAAHRGERIQVFGIDGKLVADGKLAAFDGTSLGVRGNDGRIVYVHEFATVQFPEGSGLPGSTLQVVVEGKAGAATAALTYPASGLGWRAAYSALLLDETHLRLDALASIANRSGRDFPASKLKLVAGEPNLGRINAPQPVMMKAMAAAPAPAPDELPEQSSLGDYRSYTIDGSLDLPDASVTQVPLYSSRDIPCTRRWLVEYGGTWVVPKPQLRPEAQAGETSSPVNSQLSFTAVDNLPSGNLRVLTRDRDGRTELLGENRIGDTAKTRDVTIALGTAFDLAARRERTAFSVDKAAREMNEGFRVTLTNTGDIARTITVIEHPNRWRNWRLQSPSQKPERQTPDTLEFRVAVPANGKATLDYTLHYSWTAADE